MTSFSFLQTEFPLLSYIGKCPSNLFFGVKFTLENLKYKENLAGWKVFNLVYFFAIYITGLICLAYMANYVLSN